MISPEIQQFSFSNTEVRAIITPEGVIYFVAQDVCKALHIGNVTDAMSRLDDDEKSIFDLIEHGRSYEKPIITESGLYSLVLSSRKPEAKAFKKWVTSEVLPALRKTGKYEMPTEEDFDENGTAITMKGATQKMDYEAQAATTFLQIIRECVGQELTTFQRKEFGDFKHILLHKQAQTEERLINAMQALAQKVGKELDFEVPPQASYVYLIRRIDFINVAGLLKCKVGKSNDPAFRKFRLESGGADLEVLEEIWFPNEHTALLWERAIKALFDTYKADREWFLLEERHIHFFKALAKCLTVLYA